MGLENVRYDTFLRILMIMIYITQKYNKKKLRGYMTKCATQVNTRFVYKYEICFFQFDII